MCADVSCWSICDRSDQGNAGALNALDPSACFFLRLSKHTSTHMLTSSPSHLPLVGYPPPLSLAASSPSVRPLRIQTASQSGTLSSPTFVIGWRALWMRILSFERQSRLSWLRRSLSLSVSLSRVISLSPPLFCNTTTTCWFLTKPLLLLPLTPPLLLSSAVLFYSLLIISFFAPLNPMLPAPPPPFFFIPCPFFILCPCFSPTLSFCLWHSFISTTFSPSTDVRETWRWVEPISRPISCQFFVFTAPLCFVNFVIPSGWRERSVSLEAPAAVVYASGVTIRQRR